MKTTRSLLTGALLGVVLAGGTAAVAMPGGHERGGDFGGDFGGGIARQLGRIERLADELDLTETQREAARELADTALDQARPVMRLLADNRRELRTLTREGNPDPAVVAELAARQGELMAELIVLKVNTRSDLRALLTPDQLAQIEGRRGRRSGG